MPLATIGRNSTADLLLSAPGALLAAAVSYKSQFQFFSIRNVVPQIDISTFSSEPRTTYTAGSSSFIATMNGLLMSGTGAFPIATLWFPPAQKVAGTFQYHTSCTVSTPGDTGVAATRGWWNFEDTLATRGVNVHSVMAGTARSSGVVAVAWVTSG